LRGAGGVGYACEGTMSEATLARRGILSSMPGQFHRRTPGRPGLAGGSMKGSELSELTLPELGLIAATRGMLGAGAALLLADRLSEDQRRVIGWTLFLMGVVSTIPLAIDVFSKRR
jgi:hypothetical protein